MIRAMRLAALALALGVAGATAGGCGGPSTPGTPSTPSTAAASVTPGGSAALVSPVTGVLVKLDSQGLTQVTGFRLRLDDGTEVAFTMGPTENGVEFPPGHLAEHMASSSRVRVFFRDVDGVHVVYRLEDGE